MASPTPQVPPNFPPVSKHLAPCLFVLEKKPTPFSTKNSRK